MQEMHIFDDMFTIDDQALINHENNFHKQRENLIKTRFQSIAKYLHEDATLEDMIITEKALSLGEEYAEALYKSSLTTDEKKIALYGFQKELNVMEQLEGGEHPDNLITLIDACSIKGFRIMDFFDETGSFINYPKLLDFVKNHK